MSKYVWGEGETEFFFHLGPDQVLDAVEKLGLKTTGRCLTLNSMENRVYEIEIDRPEHEIKSVSDKFVVAKFYRPGRWTKEQILEEHEFLWDLKDEEIPVIAPLKFDGETLFKLPEHDLWYTIFPKMGGRMPEEMTNEQIEIMGRLLARIHNVGSLKKSNHRISITPDTFGRQNLNYILDNNFVPPHLEQGFKSVVEEICTTIDPLFKDIPVHRIHGDCHHGNVIMREKEGPFFIDFDDMLVGPAIQDIWLTVPGDDQYAINQRNILMDSYDSMRTLDYRHIKLIEPLRSLRFIHFAAWTAKRWEDPAFKVAFPHFGNGHYWEMLTNDLRRQLSKINDSLAPSPYY